MKAAFGRVEEVNKELWVLLSLFAICLLLNLVVDGQRMVLSFYTLPTLGSAYLLRPASRDADRAGQRAPGRPDDLVQPGPLRGREHGWRALGSTRWLDIAVWGGVLIVTGYSMGTLYEHKTSQLDELRETYHGVLHASSATSSRRTRTPRTTAIAFRSTPRRSR